MNTDGKRKRILSRSEAIFQRSRYGFFYFTFLTRSFKGEGINLRGAIKA
jgi:hypothetical protein